MAEKDAVEKNADAKDAVAGDIVSTEKQDKAYGSMEISYKRNK